MRSQRFGGCKKQHSEIYIKSNIRSWLKHVNNSQGVIQSKAELEKNVQEIFEGEVVKGAIEGACEWGRCSGE